MRPNGWLLGLAGDLEGNGCLPPGQGLAAARLVAQALPSSKDREYALLNSQTRTTGRSDLLPWTKLRVTTPIFREGAPAGAQIATDDPRAVEAALGGLAITRNKSADSVGYEFAWYGLRPQPGGGVQMEFEFSETHIGDETTRQEASRQRLDFGADSRYFRMLVLTRISDKDHNTAFLAGSTLAGSAPRPLRPIPLDARGRRGVSQSTRVSHCCHLWSSKPTARRSWRNRARRFGRLCLRLAKPTRKRSRHR